MHYFTRFVETIDLWSVEGLLCKSSVPIKSAKMSNAVQTDSLYEKNHPTSVNEFF